MTAPADPPPGCAYWAYIVCARSDVPVATSLARHLQRYRIPRSARAAATELRGAPPRARRLRGVYVDAHPVDEAGDLGAVRKEALERSRMLVVIGSPPSAQSRWVGATIEHFKRHVAPDRVLCVIAAGEPNALTRGFPAELECFHRALQFDQSALESVKKEPIAADLRPDRDGPRNALLKVIAGIIGVRFRELSGRDQVARRRRALAIAGGLLALLLVGAVVAQQVWGEAASRRRQQEVALIAGAADAAARQDFATAQAMLARLPAPRRSLFATRFLARACQRPTTWRADAPVGQPLSPEGADVMSLDTTPNAQMVLCATRGGNILTIDCAPPYRAAEIDTDWGRPATARALPEQGLALLFAGPTIQVWDVNARRRLAGMGLMHGNVWGACGTRDGRFLLARNSLGSITVFSADQGKLVGSFVHEGHHPWCMEVSPDGATLAAGYSRGALVLWDLKTQQISALMHAGTESITGVSYTRQGDRLITCGADSSLRVWDVRSRRELISTSVYPARLLAAAVSPDGRELAVAADFALELWDAHLAQRTVRLMETKVPVMDVAFVRDGAALVYRLADGSVRIIDLAAP